MKGNYTICENDVAEGMDFSDTVARGLYWIDIHCPMGYTDSAFLWKLPAIKSDTAQTNGVTGLREYSRALPPHIIWKQAGIVIQTKWKPNAESLLLDTQAMALAFAKGPGRGNPFHGAYNKMTQTMMLTKGGLSWEIQYRDKQGISHRIDAFSHDPILIADTAVSEQNAYEHISDLNTRRLFCDGKPLTLDNPEVPHPVCVTMNPDAKRLSPAVPEGSSSS